MLTIGGIYWNQWPNTSQAGQKPAQEELDKNPVWSGLPYISLCIAQENPSKSKDLNQNLMQISKLTEILLIQVSNKIVQGQ